MTTKLDEEPAHFIERLSELMMIQHDGAPLIVMEEEVFEVLRVSYLQIINVLKKRGAPGRQSVKTFDALNSASRRMNYEFKKYKEGTGTGDATK